MNAYSSLNAGALIAPLNIEQITAARLKAIDAMDEAIEAIAKSHAIADEAAELAKAATGGRCSYLHVNDRDYANDRLHPDFDIEKTKARYRRWLNATIWQRIIDEARLKEIMDRQLRDELDAQMAGNELPEPTIENVHATLEGLLGDANMMFQRGVARAFSELSPAFKSHDAFKIGRRMIFEWVFNDYGQWSYSGRGEAMRRTIADVERVFSHLSGNRSFGSFENAVEASRRGGWGARQSEVTSEYFTARVFKNGNLHIWIKDNALLASVNRVLAAYYGEVLPDAAGAEETPREFRTRTDLTKDLAFYPSPVAVVEELLDGLTINRGSLILEPSAGVGAICRPLLAKGAIVHAVEVHPDRAEALRGMAHPNLDVTCANFLKVQPRPIYDKVICNPPFHGTAWADHIKHAFAFLKPGGVLRAVLPASAEVGSTKRHEQFRAWAEQHAIQRNWRPSMWKDLPAESFASVGVRINTVILTLARRKE